jgi:hypothetical protein
MREETNLLESFEGGKGAIVAFPFLGAWWASIFNLFLENLILITKNTLKMRS